MKTENNIISTFPGAFAGKMAFCSDVADTTNLYLTTFKESDGEHNWIYTPAMNALTLTETEKFILYLYPDGYYRIQSGDLRWLSLETKGRLIEYSDDLSKAAAFAMNKDSSDWHLSVLVSDCNEPLSYMLQKISEIPNTLGTGKNSRLYNTFALTNITPSLKIIREQKQAVNADFTNVILTGQDLSQGIDFSGANFVGAQLSGVDFSNAKLDRVNMSQTDLRGLKWGNPVSASGINLSGSNAENCVFSQNSNVLDCSEADFSSANLSGANLTKLNLQNANIAGAILNRAFLDKCLLNNANLNGVVALGTSFVGAVLTNATAQMGIFSRAIFDDAILTRVRMGVNSFLFDVNAQFAAELDTDNFPQPNLITAFSNNGITLQWDAAVKILIKGQSWLINDSAGPYKLTLSGKVIHVFDNNPNLLPAILRGASLKGVVASSANLAGADLREVKWYTSSAKLDSADLQDTVFSRSLLASVDFTQADISGVDFSDSILIQGKFTGCIARTGTSQRPISFEGAHIEGVDFSQATFSGAVLTDAVLSLETGVPLLFLPLDDQQYLTTSGIGNLTSLFLKAGFDLGKTSTVTDNSSWTIDNSQSTPKQYKIQKGASGFNVFGNGIYLFPLPDSAVTFLNKPRVTNPLVSLFANNNYNLTLSASITVQKSWIINVDADAGYARHYRFNTLQVQAKIDRLIVYGLAPVLIENLSEYPKGVAFNATTNLLNALSPNSVGPAGVPFSWIEQKLIDVEAFSTAISN